MKKHYLNAPPSNLKLVSDDAALINAKVATQPSKGLNLLNASRYNSKQRSERSHPMPRRLSKLIGIPVINPREREAP